MAQGAKVNIDIGSKADTRGFKVAETALQKLNKSVKSLAGSLGIAYGTRAIVNFGKASVKAFIADEKAAKSLQVALKNTGNSFATIATEGFISRMQQTYKVLDDELRPAFRTLLTATGDVAKSQTALELALNISAGTGKDLSAVSMALAKAYSGQTTALSRLGAGLSKATLASGDMNKIMAELTSKFSGQALAATKTYAGQMAALGVASQNSKEIIGKGLIDALTALGNDKTIDNLTQGMEDFATGIAEVIRQIGNLTGALTGGPLGKVLGAFFNTTLIGQTVNLGKATNKANMGKGVDYTGTSQYFTAESAERAKSTAIIKKNNAAETAKGKLTQAELDAKKKASELDELKKKFDINRINLETALLNSKDDAEKARIQSLLTIMDEDANSAAKRLAELDAANAAKMKAEQYAADTLKYLAQEADRAAKGLASIGNPNGIYPSGTPYDPRSGNTPDSPIAPDMGNSGDMGNPNGIYDYTPANPSFTYAPPIINNFDFSNSVGTSDDFADAVKRAMQKVNRFGDSTTYAGAIA